MAEQKPQKVSQLGQLLVGQAPTIIEFAMELLRKKITPGQPQPTSADVIKAFEAVFLDSFARGQFHLAVLDAEKAKAAGPSQT